MGGYGPKQRGLSENPRPGLNFGIRGSAEREQSVAELEAAALDPWEIGVPVVIDRPGQQQRVPGARDGIERSAEVEITDLHQRSMLAADGLDLPKNTCPRLRTIILWVCSGFATFMR